VQSAEAHRSWAFYAVGTLRDRSISRSYVYVSLHRAIFSPADPYMFEKPNAPDYPSAQKFFRHCEERKDEAIQSRFPRLWMFATLLAKDG